MLVPAPCRDYANQTVYESPCLSLVATIPLRGHVLSRSALLLPLAATSRSREQRVLPARGRGLRRSALLLPLARTRLTGERRLLPVRVPAPDGSAAAPCHRALPHALHHPLSLPRRARPRRRTRVTLLPHPRRLRLRH